MVDLLVVVGHADGSDWILVTFASVERGSRLYATPGLPRQFDKKFSPRLINLSGSWVLV